MLSYAGADRLQTGMGGVFGKLRCTVSVSSNGFLIAWSSFQQL